MRSNHLKWVDISVILTRQFRKKDQECNRYAKRQKKNNIIQFKRK